jgi:hypothetical protein
VLLADGATPARGAVVSYFEPGQSEPIIVGIVDAAGNIRPREFPRNINGLPAGVTRGPEFPTLVASLPGACGARIAPPPQQPGELVRLVLPPAMALAGSVTVGGAPPTNRPGRIRVLAAFQGRGFLDSALSVETTADVDGRFTLAGLTPGKYKVQAALDDIWVSPTTTIEVVDKKREPIALAIPAPGAPVLVHLRDHAGKPLVGEPMTIDRPPGPLSDALWPREWSSDGAGLVYIPTLEAGDHVVHARGSKAVHITVTPLPADKPVEVDFVVDR